MAGSAPCWLPQSPAFSCLGPSSTASRTPGPTGDREASVQKRPGSPQGLLAPPGWGGKQCLGRRQMLGLKNLRCSQPPAVGAVGGEMRVTGPP